MQSSTVTEVYECYSSTKGQHQGHIRELVHRICYSLLIKNWTTKSTTLEIVITMFYPSVPPVPINVPLLTGACSIFNRFVFS